MTLDMAKKGEKFQIVDILDAQVKAQAIRFGIFEGQEVMCAETVPAGPIIIRKNAQEIAIGRGLAKLITVSKLPH